MKTEFEKKLTEALIAERGRIASGDIDTIKQVLSDITGKFSYVVEIPSIFTSYREVFTKPDEVKEIQDLYDQIIKEFSLERGPRVLFSRTKDRKPILEELDLFLYGESYVCRVDYEDSIPEIQYIIYTESSERDVREIWMKYAEKYLEVKKKYQKKVEKSYEITTVLMRDGGRYESIKTGIFPTVELTSDDFMKNYNSDFPKDKIKNFLEMDKGGIIIFNGHPGCGKSTYLKSLVFRYPDIDFVILPQYLLANQEAFRQFLFRMVYGEKDCVYIVEDCEQLLVQRENNQGFSSIIGDILNYTDGIFGDLTRTKFIFTFNTDLRNIDKAILRPGRLYLRYEFAPLRGENLEIVATKVGYTLSEEEKKTGIPLSELYYKTKTEDMTVNKPKRMGYM